MNHWHPRDIKALAALRERFLAGTAGDADYWRSEEELALYDDTFGARIGWKIDAVLRGLQAIGWRPRSRRILDWGCGSGIAARRVLAKWSGFEEVAVHDRSPLAMTYARRRIRAEYPQLPVEASESVDRGTLLVISHALNELAPNAVEALLTAAAAAGEVIWVEAGTHPDSRRLIEMRQRILMTPEPPRVVAPCTHSLRCGLLTPDNARHWCHFFADPPQQVFNSARWDEWSRALGIDRRSLPYSYLVLSRHEVPALDGFARIIGVPREAKACCHILSCERAGVQERMLQKRDAPGLYRMVLKEREFPPLRWQLDGAKIVAGEVAAGTHPA